MEMGAPFFSGAEVMPWPSSAHVTPPVSNREYFDKPSEQKQEPETVLAGHSASSSVLPLRPTRHFIIACACLLMRLGTHSVP